MFIKTSLLSNQSATTILSRVASFCLITIPQFYLLGFFIIQFISIQSPSIPPLVTIPLFMVFNIGDSIISVHCISIFYIYYYISIVLCHFIVLLFHFICFILLFIYKYSMLFFHPTMKTFISSLDMFKCLSGDITF